MIDENEREMVLKRSVDYICGTMKRFLSIASPLRKYFTEKNALTVMASLFCFTMMIISFGKQEWVECVAFALAFSFSIEVICHRAKEKS